jgi:FtsP/CotA-like multicopper oxidase with cupredoxin domain
MLTRRKLLELSLAASAAPFTPAGAIEQPHVVLGLERRTIEVNGKAASRLAIRQPDGFMGVVTEVDKPYRVRVENRLDVPSLVHWHGLTPPWRQDGVPGISGPPIPAGGSEDYDFPLTFPGTFFMHSHEGFQEQLLMAAPLIIRDPGAPQDEQDIVMLLSDFSFTPPQDIYAKLRAPTPMAMSGDMHAAHAATKASMPGIAMPMRQAGPDLNDVKYDAFLANDRTLADPEIVKVEPGGKVRLRVINASSMTNFHIDLGTHEGELIAVDGHDIHPVKGRRFPIAVAQRLDIRLAIPRERAAHPILAVVEGESNRTGIILEAGHSVVKRVPETIETASAALTLDLERSLRALHPLAERPIDRTHTLDLTGNMTGYQWSINNITWTPETPPLPVREGERVALVFTNKTTMPHPMHLHGHVFQVVAIDGQRIAGAKRDTVLVPPKTSVTVVFDADNPGWWALHCHLLYHMEAGMFATVRYV